MEKFDLLASDIKDLELKLKGELPVDRDELLALANSWGRNCFIFFKDKNGNMRKIESYEIKEKYDLSKLDVSKITNFDSIFRESNFNGDISKWDVSNTTSMDYMFNFTTNFNSYLDNWDTSKVTSMYCMFQGSKKFNQNINIWNTSNVTNMSHMFSYSKEFNQNLNSWNISKVTNINSMFEYARAFNQPILWNLSQITYCNDIFFESKAFMDKFNKGKDFPFETNGIKEWLKENQNKMVAIEMENSKSKDLDNFLSNFQSINLN